MNTKMNFLKYAITRMEDDHEFMSHTLKKYCEFEQISETELLKVLGCPIGNYYKLALCKAPDVSQSDFMQRLVSISEYAHIELGKLIMIIKHVHTVLTFTGKPGNMLLAARDKENGKDRSNEIK
jgi:hypothetical protein